MKVKDLIAALQKENPEADACILEFRFVGELSYLARSIEHVEAGSRSAISGAFAPKDHPWADGPVMSPVVALKG